jgi:hypothetical protein
VSEGDAVEFLLHWFGYLAAFVLGSALTWMVLVFTVEPRSDESGEQP